MEALNLEGGHMTRDQQEQEMERPRLGDQPSSEGAKTIPEGELPQRTWKNDKAHERVMQVLESNLTTSEKMILIVLADGMGGEDTWQTKYETIAERASIHSNHLGDLIAKLEDEGWFDRPKRHSKGYTYRWLMSSD